VIKSEAFRETKKVQTHKIDYKEASIRAPFQWPVWVQSHHLSKRTVTINKAYSVTH